MKFYRLNEGLTKYSLIPVNEDVHTHIKDNEKDYYKSLYLYNEEQYNKWKATGTIAGITDTLTSKLLFDFDSKEDIEQARKDALTTVARLEQRGIQQDNIQIAFSGQKGFSVEVDSTSTFTPAEFKTIVFALASDLKSFDTVVNDPNRIIRIVGTKHQRSGLYKIPLTANELAELPIDAIRGLARNGEYDPEVMNAWKPIILPENIIKLKETEKKVEKVSVSPTDLDLSLTPKWISPVRFALQEGFFPANEGVRNHAFMILASTYKKQGFNADHTLALLKAVAEIQAERNNCEEFPEKELKRNIIDVIYSPTWKGGIYKDSEDAFLIETANRLGLKINRSEDTDYTPKGLHSLHAGFKNYVKNIEKNTILTGIDSLDEYVFISTGANVGIVGAPGSGKSALALNILNNTSKVGIKSVFASFDMARTRMYEKILYKLTGYTREKLYWIMKSDPKEEERIHNLVKEEFGNVYFFDKSAATVEDIERYLVECNNNSEEKVKLVMIDYFERVNVDMNEDTAASKKIAGQIQDMVNRNDIACITLLQPNKMSGNMSEPIESYTNIKGSSFLAQSFRIVISIFREGFAPRNPEQDRFLTMNVLKNDLGETASLDFSWRGKTGMIYEIDDEERQALNNIRASRAVENQDEF